MGRNHSLRASMTIVLLCLFSGTAFPALACAILPPDEQAARDAESLSRERSLAADMVRRADRIFIGEVLTTGAADRNLQVASTLRVVESLKGDAGAVTIVPASIEGVLVVLSCDSADMFGNVDFRVGASYLVYLKDGIPLRAAPVGERHFASSLGFAEERKIVLQHSAQRDNP